VGVVPKHAKKEKTPPLYKQNIFREKKSAYIYICCIFHKKEAAFSEKSENPTPLAWGKKTTWDSRQTVE